MRAAGLHIRVLAAWLIAMQPLFGAYAAARADHAPLAMELCRGAPAPTDNAPAPQRDHTQCCLVACTPATGPAPESAAIVAPRVHTASVYLPPVTRTISRAGLGPQSARAPPL
jgi:hypothetical protein